MKFKMISILLLVASVTQGADLKAINNSAKLGLKNAANTSSLIGSEGVGGGDPDAVDFIAKIRAIGKWSKTGNSPLNSDEAQRVFSVAQELSKRMDNPAETPIVMTDKNLKDASGTSKLALYDRPNFKIRVTRAKWKNLREEDKFVTAALELFGLSEVQDRYGVAGLLRTDMTYLKQVNVAAEEDMYIGWWKSYGKNDFGYYQGTDLQNRSCAVTLHDGPSSYNAGDLNRRAQVEFAELNFSLYFNSVVNGQAQMLRSSFMYSTNEQGKKVWNWVDEGYSSPIFFDGWKMHKTLDVEARLDLRGSRSVMIATENGNFVCANLQKWSNAAYISLILPKFETLFKKSLAEEAQRVCIYACAEKKAILTQMAATLNQSKQRLAAGDGKGATESLIRFISSVTKASEDFNGPISESFDRLVDYAYDKVMILVHLEN